MDSCIKDARHDWEVVRISGGVVLVCVPHTLDICYMPPWRKQVGTLVEEELV